MNPNTEQQGNRTSVHAIGAPAPTGVTLGPIAEDLSPLTDRARGAMLRKDWQEAIRCWDRIRAQYPDHAAAYVGGADALRETGRLDEADHLLNAAVARFPANASVAMSHANLANARRDWPVALGRWECVRKRFPGDPWVYIGSARALGAAGHADQVENFLAMAESVAAASNARSLDAASRRRLALEVAKLRGDWHAVKQTAGEILATDIAPSVGTFVKLAQACWHLDDHDGADRAASHALQLDPNLTDALIIRAWVAGAQGDADQALACHRRLAAVNPNNPHWSLKLIQMLNSMGHIEESLSALEVLCGRWPTDPAVRAFIRYFGPAGKTGLDSAAAGSGLRQGSSSSEQDLEKEKDLDTLVRKAPTGERHLRPRLVDEPGRDLLMAEVNNARTAVLLFTGTNDGLAVPLEAFDLYLAALPVTGIYLKDFRRLRYLLGIRSLSGDYAGTLVALRETLDRLGVERVVSLGNCEGGFAAIRYGVELGADRIVAFEPPTCFGEESSGGFGLFRTFKRNRLSAAAVPHEMTDLKPFLEARGGNIPIEIFFNEQRRDRHQAQRLAALPGIQLRPIQVHGNRLALRHLMLSHEDFCGFLAGLLNIQAARGVLAT